MNSLLIDSSELLRKLNKHTERIYEVFINAGELIIKADCGDDLEYLSEVEKAIKSVLGVTPYPDEHELESFYIPLSELQGGRK